MTDCHQTFHETIMRSDRRSVIHRLEHKHRA